MAPEEKKRPHRIPLTPEEVAQLVALKKRKEARKLALFKKTIAYRVFNVFNICCFFIYWEILFCFMGPCHYQTHYARSFGVKHGDEMNAAGKRIISEMDILNLEGKKIKLYVRDYIDVPEKFSSYQIGKDYILQKELKAMLLTSEDSYGLQSASSIIFLSVFIIIISCISFFYNLNENSHSLTAVAILNAITILAFATI
jgi:hypothetical protein